MKKIAFLLVVLLAGYGGVKALGIYTTKDALAGKVERQLDRVNAVEDARVKSDIIEEASRLGVELKPRDIQISFADADVRSIAQKMVARTGMKFQNKRVAIQVRYQAALLGVQLQQEIDRSAVRQVSVMAPAPQRDVQELLDSTR